MSARPKASGWYFFKAGSRSGQQAGPFSWEQLRSLAPAGTLEPADMVWNPQLGQWQLAAQIPDLFPTLVSPGVPPTYPSPPPPGASATTRSRSWLPWLAPLVALILVGGGLGVYLGAYRDSGESTVGGQTTTTLAVATTSVTMTAPSEVTTTTEAPAAWANLNPAGEVPSARTGHAMVCDPETGRVILFGGIDALGETAFNDTWAYDPSENTWTNLNPSGEVPSARAGHAMVYDPGTRRVILSGGVGSVLYGDNWAYDPAANTWTLLNPSGGVVQVALHSMVYDPRTSTMVLFGGHDFDLGISWMSTKVYDPAANTWTMLDPSGEEPSARAGHSMVYDPGSGSVVLFGGVGNAETGWNDTWAYDAVANTWTNLNPSGEVPSARTGQSMVYDPGSGRVILFGGWDPDAQIDLNDTWAFGG